jgi:hypothetical protein
MGTIPIEPTPADLGSTHNLPYSSVPISIGTYGGPTEEQQAGPKPEIPGSRCHNPLSTK